MTRVEEGIQSALAEINEKLAEFLPVQEGMADLLRLNLDPHTASQVQENKVKYDRRIAILFARGQQLQDALMEIMGDGHPDIPVQSIDASSLEDLRRNELTIEAALSKFDSNAASSLEATSGAAVSKS